LKIEATPASSFKIGDDRYPQKKAASRRAMMVTDIERQYYVSIFCRRPTICQLDIYTLFGHCKIPAFLSTARRPPLPLAHQNAY